MISRFLLLFLGLALLSCGEKLIDPPEDLISRETMIDILYDISIINSIDNTYPTALKDNDLEVMRFVYEKYGVDSTQFTQSDLYYASEPRQYREIYQALHDRIQQRRDSITDAIQKGQNEDKIEDTSEGKD